jgi:apolipoprotein N-acyltransferase
MDIDTVPTSIEQAGEQSRQGDERPLLPSDVLLPSDPFSRSQHVEQPSGKRPGRLRRALGRRPRPGVHWLPQLAAAACGLMLVASFPPIGWWWLAPPSVAGFTLSALAAAQLRERRGIRRPAVAGAWAGLWFGLGFCILMFQWVTSVGTDAWIALGIVEALYFVPLGAATAAVGGLRAAPLWQAMLWIADEAARGRWPLNGFSWGRLAFSQSDTVFTPLAALGGAPLVSFATALAGTALAVPFVTAYRQRARRMSVSASADSDSVLAAASVSVSASAPAATAAAAGPAVSGPASSSPGVPASGPPGGPVLPVAPARPPRRPRIAAFGWLVFAAAVPAVGMLVPLQTTAGTPVQLAAIQGNVPRTGLDAYGQSSAVLDNHLSVTEQYAAAIAAGKTPKPAAVFWPEDSDDIDPFKDPTVYAELTQAAKDVGTQVLVGSVVDAGPGRARNEGIVWDPKTGPGATYTKRNLVPFGEYIPYRSFLTRYISELSRVPRDFIPGDKPGVLTVGGVRIADVICFEVSYDSTVRDSVRGDGGVIVIQTNNATYGWTGQPEQQLAISQLRAVEHGRPVMIAATSGISGYITPDGTVQQETTQFTPAVVAADVTPRTGMTLADRVGAWPELAMSAAALGAWALATVLRRTRRGSRSSAREDVIR